jgi:hypothetical protein
MDHISETDTVTNSPILRRHRKRKRSRAGHEGNGRQGQGRRAPLRREQAELAPPGRRRPTEQILGPLLQHGALVQLCQPQPARRGHGKVLPAGREGAGGGAKELDKDEIHIKRKEKIFCVYFSENIYRFLRRTRKNKKMF